MNLGVFSKSPYMNNEVQIGP